MGRKTHELSWIDNKLYTEENPRCKYYNKGNTCFKIGGSCVGKLECKYFKGLKNKDFEFSGFKDEIELYDSAILLSTNYNYNLRITVVPDGEEDVFNYRISNKSDLAKVILGRKIGEIIEINKQDKLVFKVVKIDKYKA